MSPEVEVDGMTDDMKDYILDLLEENRGYDEIRRESNASIEAIKYLQNKDPPAITEEEIDKISDYYQRGKTFAEISRLMNIDRETLKFRISYV